MLSPLSIPPPPTLVAPVTLSSVEWSALMDKVQSSQPPSITVMAPIDPLTFPLSTLPIPLMAKIFTAESATFSLESGPGALPDTILQMAL